MSVLSNGYVTYCLAMFFLGSTLLLPIATYADSGKNSITIGIEDFPATFFPVLRTGSLSGQAAGQLFASLCRLTPKGELEPYLAEKLSYSADYTALSIRLRSNAYFHDKVPITAKDITFSLETARELHPYDVVFSSIDTIHVHDTKNITIRFTSPQPHFLKICIPSLLPVIPKHIYKTPQGVADASMDNIVGSGPFQIDFVTSSRIVLKKFPLFFLKGRPYLEGVTFAVYNDIGDSYYRHVAQELDISAFRWDYVADTHLEQHTYLAIRTREYQNIQPYFVLQFNLRKSPFDNVLVRKAFTLAIDRAFLARNGLGAKGRFRWFPCLVHCHKPVYFTARLPILMPMTLRGPTLCWMLRGTLAMKPACA